MTEFAQIAPGEWPTERTRPIAIVAMSPSELQSTRGIAFVTGSDDFDAFQLAVLELPSGTRVSLMRYSGGPAGDTDVYGYVRYAVDEVVDELVNALNISPSLISWRAAGPPGA